MGFAASNTILEYWNEEVLPREKDFLEAESAIPETNNREVAYRRAIDAASAFAAFSDIIAAKDRSLTLANLRYAPAGGIKDDQGSLRHLAKTACNEFKILCDLNNTYKHGVLVPNNAQIVPPRFETTTTSVTITSTASFDRNAELPPDKTEYRIKISWYDGQNNREERFSDLFSKTKTFWKSQPELQLP